MAQRQPNVTTTVHSTPFKFVMCIEVDTEKKIVQNLEKPKVVSNAEISLAVTDYLAAGLIIIELAM